MGVAFSPGATWGKTMMTIEKKSLTTPTGGTKEYFYDAVTPAEYRRIVGGIAWRWGDMPGFVVVIGEDYHKDPTLKLRHIRLLAEYENLDPLKIVKRLYDYQNTYLVSPWYGEDENEMMMHFVSKFNKTLGSKKKGVFISGAPFVDDPHNLQFYANQIKNRMSRVKKSLHLGGDSRLPGRLSAISPDEVQKTKVQGYPAVAALGYAIAGLDEPYFDVMKHRELQEQMAANYNVAGL